MVQVLNTSATTSVLLMERELLCCEHDDCIEREDLARACINKGFVEDAKKDAAKLAAAMSQTAIAALPPRSTSARHNPFDMWFPAVSRLPKDEEDI